MMSAATTTEAARKPATQPQSDVIAFMRLICGMSKKPGYIEIVAGVPYLDANGKPIGKIALQMWTQDDQSCTHTRKFFYLDMERPDLFDTAREYALKLYTTYRNVYVSRGLYNKSKDDKPHRDPCLAIPSRLIVIDDVKVEQANEFACYIQTSAEKGHGYAITDKHLNNDAYDDIARRITTAYSGDPSGVDVTQLIRLPNTENTKNGGAFRVQMLHLNPHRVLTVDTIRNAYPAAAGYESTYRPRSSSAAYNKGHYENLREGEALWNNSIVQKAINVWRVQLKKVLIDKERVTTYRKDGTPDDSLSAQRAVVISNLLQLHKPFPLSDVRALALVVKPIIGPDLSDSAYRRAIDVEIDTYMHLLYTAKGKTYSPHAVRLSASDVSAIPVPEKETKLRGRPYATGETRADKVAQLRTILAKTKPDAFGIVPVNTAAIAKKIGKSPRMVRNYLNDLAEQKEIKYAASGKGKKLAVLLIDTPETGNIEKEIKSEAAESTVSLTDTLETAHSEKEIKSAETATPEMPVLPIAAMEIEVQPDSPIESTESNYNCGGMYSLETRACEISSEADDDSPWPVALIFQAMIARDFIDTSPPMVDDMLLDTETGEVTLRYSTGKAAYRRTKYEFADRVNECYGDLFPHDDAIAAYEAHRAYCDEMKDAAWKLFFNRIKAMSSADLIAFIRHGCRTEVNALKQAGNTRFNSHLFNTRRTCAKRELERRGVEMPAKELRSTSKKPAPQPVAAPAVRVRTELPPIRPIDLFDAVKFRTLFLSGESGADHAYVAQFGMDVKQGLARMTGFDHASG